VFDLSFIPENQKCVAILRRFFGKGNANAWLKPKVLEMMASFSSHLQMKSRQAD